MSVGVGIQITDNVSPRLAAFLQGIRDRTQLHQAIGSRARDRVRDHLIKLAGTRHATAQRLGAKPSGHLGQAAEKTTFTADSEAATISIAQPGIGRAAHDVTIKPTGGKKFLTIPLIAEAYNQRAYRIPGLFRPGAKGAKKRVLSKREPDGTLTHWYALVASVHQKQDRTLLPSDTEFSVAAQEGVRDYVDYLINKGTGK